MRSKLDRALEWVDTLEKLQREDPTQPTRGWPDVNSIEFQKARNRLLFARNAIEDAFDSGELLAIGFTREYGPGRETEPPQRSDDAK